MGQTTCLQQGLSCNVDHWHHPYWRFDFALGLPETQRVAVFHEGDGKIAGVGFEGGLINSWFDPTPEYHITSTQERTDVGRIKAPAQVVIIPPHVDLDNGVVGPTE